MSGKNPFFTEDDEVDDDEFLRNSRPNGGGYGGHPDPIDERRQQLMQTRRQIEERTLDSSQRSLGLLYESEKVGVATADELSRQKDQLKNTEQRLDDINSTLKQSERHLNGIKSVFGGLRNYFSGKGAASTAAAGAPPSKICMSDPPSAGARVGPAGSYPDHGGGIGVPPSNPNHPGLRMRGLAEDPHQHQHVMSTSDAVNAQLDKNIDDMALGLSRLKGLAQNLNSELEDHNEIVDRLDHKTANTNWRVEKQNKDMGKLLGGKKKS